jgi:hypothetical protein
LEVRIAAAFEHQPQSAEVAALIDDVDGAISLLAEAAFQPRKGS